MPRELVPQQRMGNEEELAGTILYLASKVQLNKTEVCVCGETGANGHVWGQAGGYCNGVTMILDGGFLMNHAGQ